MTEPFDRKAAKRACKEQRPRPGVYAVRHRVSGRAWVGSSPNVDTTRNGLWHTLEEGRHLDRDLQEAWKAHGGAAFTYEILEVIGEDLEPPFLKDALKALKARWTAQLAHPGPPAASNN